jgi:hypothetical protein
MPDQITKRLADLPTLSRAALYDLWKQLFDAFPPPKLCRDLMIPSLLIDFRSRPLDLSTHVIVAAFIISYAPGDYSACLVIVGPKVGITSDIPGRTNESNLRRLGGFRHGSRELYRPWRSMPQIVGSGIITSVGVEKVTVI